MIMYKPKPIDTTDVVLSKDLLELTQIIAENVHEVRTEGRIQEDWSYGAVRDDAMETIKLIMKLRRIYRFYRKKV